MRKRKLRALYGLVVCMREVSCRSCRRVLGLALSCVRATTPGAPALVTSAETAAHTIHDRKPGVRLMCVLPFVRVRAVQSNGLFSNPQARAERAVSVRV
eukprot:1143185-Prymnesium_polylepis.1